jgi:hypothetical protein
LPALVITYEDPDLGRAKTVKAHGSMVACGPVFQGFRVPWTGQTEQVPEDQDKAELFKLMWW